MNWSPRCNCLYIQLVQLLRPTSSICIYYSILFYYLCPLFDSNKLMTYLFWSPKRTTNFFSCFWLSKLSYLIWLARCVSGITFIRHAQSQKIWKLNKTEYLWGGIKGFKRDSTHCLKEENMNSNNNYII